MFVYRIHIYIHLFLRSTNSIIKEESITHKISLRLNHKSRRGQDLQRVKSENYKRSKVKLNYLANQSDDVQVEFIFIGL